ncbi:hypothetical protein BU16DRAFT_568047 [Lophium mytilinum]|uniref:HAT C-terminal dimerisation domain-containing protein n=1 Tax=Lophium mytilinum TaxID=390894 RepID=A0A6A6Q8V3_9PEZI|nr:hypothetical protein BU16DRAFT_568047 [Lophium mytilinum]
MALNHLPVPAMSMSNERDFNQIGLLWNPRRSALHANVVGACMSLSLWDKEGVIDMLDGGLVRGNQLKRRRADTIEDPVKNENSDIEEDTDEDEDRDEDEDEDK